MEAIEMAEEFKFEIE
jgi:hypothetical protein